MLGAASRLFPGILHRQHRARKESFHSDRFTILRQIVLFMVSVHWRILLMATVRFPDVTRRGKLVAAAVVLLFAQISFLVLESPIRFSAFLVARRRLLWHWFCWPAGLLAARTGRVCRSGLPIRRSTSAITCSCVMPRTTLPVTCSGPQLGSAGLRPIQRGCAQRRCTTG